MKKAGWFIICLLIMTAARGDEPAKTEQLVYSVEVFNGKEYSATFCPEFSNAIYVLAETENFFQIRKSLAYFWPLSGTWQLDTQRLYESFDGYLQLENSSGKMTTLPLQTYTYSRTNTEYEEQIKVYLDAAAEQAGQEFEVLLDSYKTRQEAYQQEMAVYEQYTHLLIDEIRRLRETGKDITALYKKVQALTPPQAPEYPNYYVYPLRRAFVVKLAAGNYKLRFLTPGGLVMEGSEKELVVFTSRRTKGIGYEIVPGDKWTKPEKSFTPSSVLYIDGTTDLYAKPFFENEFNDLYYNKMLYNHARGNRNLYRWEDLRQVPAARLEITRDDGTARIIDEKAYVVEQSSGTALGYTIVLYDPQGEHKNQSPSLKAFHIPVSRHDKYLNLRLQEIDSAYFALSTRQIRIIAASQLPFILVILALLPLAAFVIVRIMRRERLKQE